MNLLDGVIGKTYQVIKLKTEDKNIFLARGILPNTIIMIKYKNKSNHIIIIETDDITLAMRKNLASLIEVKICSY